MLCRLPWEDLLRRGFLRRGFLSVELAGRLGLVRRIRCRHWSQALWEESVDSPPAKSPLWREPSRGAGGIHPAGMPPCASLFALFPVPSNRRLDPVRLQAGVDRPDRKPQQVVEADEVEFVHLGRIDRQPTRKRADLKLQVQAGTTPAVSGEADHLSTSDLLPSLRSSPTQRVNHVASLFSQGSPHGSGGRCIQLNVSASRRVHLLWLLLFLTVRTAFHWQPRRNRGYIVQVFEPQLGEPSSTKIRRPRTPSLKTVLRRNLPAVSLPPRDSGTKETNFRSREGTLCQIYFRIIDLVNRMARGFERLQAGGPIGK